MRAPRREGCKLSERPDYDALEAAAAALIRDERISENAAAQRIAEQAATDERVESIARNLRERLRKRRSREHEQREFVLPAGAFALAKLLEERIHAYLMEVLQGDTGGRYARERASTTERLHAARVLIEDRMQHLESLDRSSAISEAERLLVPLVGLDFEVTAEHLLVLERKLLAKLLSDLAGVEAKLDRQTPF